MNVKSIIAAQKLTTSEKKLVADSAAKMKTLTELSDRYRPREEAVLQGRVSGLQDAQDQAGEAFIADPTAEKFQAFLTALAEADLIERNKPLLSDIGRRADIEARGALSQVADGVLERAAAELDKLAAERRPSAEAAGLLPEHEAKFQAAKLDLERERQAIREWPGAGAWLESHGLIG